MTITKADIIFLKTTFTVAVTTANQVAMEIPLDGYGDSGSGGATDNNGFYFIVYIVPVRQSPIQVDVGSIWAVYAYGGNGAWTTLTFGALKAPVDAFVDFALAISPDRLQVRIDGGTVAMPVVIAVRGSIGEEVL